MTYRDQIEKLERFRTSIMRGAERECAKIETELAEHKDRELLNFAEDLDSKNQALVERETVRLKIKLNRELSDKKKEYRKKLFLKREEYMNTIRAEVENKLREFADSTEYKSFLLNTAKQLASENIGEANLYIRHEDAELIPDIKRIYGECTAEASDDIRLGGILLKSARARIIIDKSLDRALPGHMEKLRGSGGMYINF